MQDQEQLQQRLKEIGGRYLRRTVGEMQRLRELAAAVCEDDTSGLAEIVQIVHRIHGGGGMFGFDSISEAARRLETTARQWLESGGNEPAGLQPRIQSLLAELERAVHSTAQSQEVP